MPEGGTGINETSIRIKGKSHIIQEALQAFKYLGDKDWNGNDEVIFTVYNIIYENEPNFIPVRLVLCIAMPL